MFCDSNEYSIMNKKVVPSGGYTFNASSGLITITDADSITLFNAESVLLITNMTKNIIIYNPYCNGYGGILDLTSYTISVEADTSNMDNSDILQIVLIDIFPSVNLQVNDIDVSNSNGVPISFSDTFNIDSFGRLRTSELTTQFDGKQLHDALDLFYDQEQIGTGATAHSTTNAETTLTTAANLDVAIMQTKQRFNYMTGKSALGFMTFRNFNTEANVTKRVGYFNSNTTTPFNSSFDGFYLENDGTDVNFVISKGGVKNTIVMADWTDPMDGTGVSGVDLDLGTEDGNLLFWFQFEWLGVGAVEFGFVKNGGIYTAHKVDHVMLDGVYMESPNHSLRYEIRQSGAGSGTFRAICASFNTEGSINKLGKVFSENLGTTHVNANSTSNKYALIGIQLQSTKADTLVDILDYSIITTTSDNQLVEVWLNPTVAGTFTYNAISDSSVAIAKGASGGSNTVTGGTLLYSDYINSQQAFNIKVENAIRLGMSIDGTVDSIVISTNPLSSNSDVLASIKWRELS